MARQFSNEFKKGFWISAYEYLLITLPVGIYVLLEAIHKDDWHQLYLTPEWSIAIIFLSFVSLSRYLSSIAKSGKQVIEPIVGIIGIFILLIIVAATVNLKMSIDNETEGTISVRLILFFFTTIIFFIFMTGSFLIYKDKNV